MSVRNAVQDLPVEGVIPHLKQRVLFFDTLYTMGLDAHLANRNVWGVPLAAAADIDFLLKREIIRPLKRDPQAPLKPSEALTTALALFDDYAKRLDTSKKRFKERVAALHAGDAAAFEHSATDEAFDAATEARDWAVRIGAIYLRARDEVDAVPLLSAGRFEKGQTVDIPVVRVVLNNIPQVDESTSFEQILEFRADEEALQSLRNLRVWMNDIGRTSLSAPDIEDKLVAMMGSYREHLNRHKLKTRNSWIEGIVVGAFGLLEKGVKLQFEAISKTLFSAHAEEVALLEAEAKAPGREVAYIVKAHEHFK